MAATTSSRGCTAGRSAAPLPRLRASGCSGPSPRAESMTSERERSRCALRATQSRNRYSTARKPNLSATASGSSTWDFLVQLESQLGQTQRDAITGLEGRLVDAPTVDLDPVRGPEVHHRP